MIYEFEEYGVKCKLTLSNYGFSILINNNFYRYFDYKDHEDDQISPFYYASKYINKYKSIIRRNKILKINKIL